MKILFFGSFGLLSSKPLKALLNNGFEVCAVAFDHTEKNTHQVGNIAIVDARSDSIESLALAHEIPILRTDKDFNNSPQDIKAFQPDIIIVSCYPRILPESVTSIAKLGCFNIHPSMLPAYRGPDPIFWQLRAAEQTMGVTIHRVTPIIDGGDILIQQSLTLNNGLSRLEIDRAFANVAAKLLLSLLSSFEHYQSCALSQNSLSIANSATYRSFAQAGDFNLSNSWPALHLYNFISAYARSDRYFSCSISGEVFRLSHALWFDMPSNLDEPNLDKPNLDKPYLIEENKITFVCSSGIIQCRLSHYHL